MFNRLFRFCDSVARFSPYAPNMLQVANLEQQHQQQDAAAAGQKGNNNNAHQNPGKELILAVVSSTINLLGFWLEKPSIWFNMCKPAFAVCQITSPITKYHHCMGKLTREMVATVEDVVNN